MADGLAHRLGGLIRDTRRAQGLRLVDLSRLSGLALATLSDLENGARDTRLSSYQRVFDALGIDAARLDIAPPGQGAPGGYDLDGVL